MRRRRDVSTDSVFSFRIFAEWNLSCLDTSNPRPIYAIAQQPRDSIMGFHFILCGSRNWDKTKVSLCRFTGHIVTSDLFGTFWTFCYFKWFTNESIIIKRWMHFYVWLVATDHLVFAGFHSSTRLDLLSQLSSMTPLPSSSPVVDGVLFIPAILFSSLVVLSTVTLMKRFFWFRRYLFKALPSRIHYFKFYSEVHFDIVALSGRRPPSQSITNV